MPFGKRPERHRIPSPTSSLTEANPLSVLNGEQPRENTVPLHDKDNPLSALDQTSIVGEDDEEITGAETEPVNSVDKGGVQSMIYNPIDQDNTTNHK